MVKVIITGGSGYLGQFLVFALAGKHQVSYTYCNSKLEKCPEGVKAFKVDLATGEGLAAAFAEPVDVVVNCAAISVPSVCEKDPEKARAVNAPNALLEQLRHQQKFTGIAALLVHFSTDQVYEGTQAMWTEEDECAPVNVYGHSKLASEMFIEADWPRHVVLRSSIIYSGPTPNPLARTPFLQFVEQALRSGKQQEYFDDEWRCPIFVEDIVEIVEKLLRPASAAPPTYTLYNMGGPERLSRADMAAQVAAALGVDPGLVVRVSAASAARGVPSPADISMNVQRIQEDLGIKLTPFSTAIKKILAA